MKDVADITTVINAIRSLCGVGICYYDLNNFFNYFHAGAKNNHGHYCDFCMAAKDLPDGRRACDKSDKSDAVALAAQYRQPFFFECHLGMREWVLPLLHEDKLIGMVFIGQCRIDGESNEKQMLQRVREANGDPDAFLRHYNRLPLLTRENLRDIGAILASYFDIRIAHSQPIGHRPASLHAPLAERVRLHIDTHYKNTLSTGKLAQTFFISEAYLSRLFRQTFGITVTAYLHKVRIDHAKDLLQNTTASVGNIALNVGYADLNYFSRIFKTHTGLTPSAFRNQ